MAPVIEIISNSVIREHKKALSILFSLLATKAGIAKSTLPLLETGKGSLSFKRFGQLSLPNFVATALGTH